MCETAADGASSVREARPLIGLSSAIGNSGDLLRPKDCFAFGWSRFLFSAAAGLPHDPVMIAAMAAGLALRLLAIRYRWNMPRFVYTRDLH
jgi:hypothetical protein